VTRAGRELERVRSLLDDLGCVVWEADGAGRFTFVSAGAVGLLGLPVDDWTSASDFRAAHLHPDDRDSALRAIASAVGEGRPFDLEYRLLHRNGAVVWVRDIGRHGPEGTTRGVMLDVSRQKLDEERRLEIELRYRRLIEQLPAIVYTETVMEEQAGIIYVSPQIHQILGIEPEAWIGSSEGWLSYVHEDDREKLREANQRSDQTGDPFAAEYRMIAADGSVVWFHDESTLVRDDDGRPLLWQGVMLDVTEQRRALELEDALVSERAEAESLREADEVKNTFLQAVSHDLRTPLAAILGLAVTLERDDVKVTEEEARDLASRIAANARKLDRIVNDLLDLDRIGRGIVQPMLIPTDVGALVERIVADSDVSRTREVVVDAPSALAHVDPPKLERIVENLLANTDRHTPSGARVWVRVRQVEGGIEIAVEDEGPGIPPELRESIFEPFFRAGGTREGVGGVGVGLALVARFTDLHGGHAWVEERDGGGASFRVQLPT
jgi:PAS domain S-box-containing protein